MYIYISSIRIWQEIIYLWPKNSEKSKAQLCTRGKNQTYSTILEIGHDPKIGRGASMAAARRQRRSISQLRAGGLFGFAVACTVYTCIEWGS